MKLSPKLLALAPLLLSAPAVGQTWNGCYFGANAGYSMTDTEATLSSPAGPGSLTIDGLGAQGAIFGGGAGCDVQLNRFIVGILADYTWHDDSEFAISANLPGFFAGDIATLSVENEWAVGGRAGYLFTPQVLGYVLVAYGRMEMSDLTGLGGTPAAFSFSTPEFTGIVWGGGIEAALGNGWFVKAEGRYADYSSESIAVIPGALNIELDPDIISARVGVAYKFNFLNVDPLKP